MGACQGINAFAPANQRSAAPPLRTSLYPWFCMKRGGGSQPPGRRGGGGGPRAGPGSHWEAFVSPLPATGHTRLLEEVGKQHCCYVVVVVFKVDVGRSHRGSGNGFHQTPRPVAKCPPSRRRPAACAALTPSAGSGASDAGPRHRKEPSGPRAERGRAVPFSLPPSDPEVPAWKQEQRTPDGPPRRTRCAACGPGTRPLYDSGWARRAGGGGGPQEQIGSFVSLVVATRGRTKPRLSLLPLSCWDLCC